MKINRNNFSDAALSVGMICCLLTVCFTSALAAEEEDLVTVEITVPTYLRVDIVSTEMKITDVYSSEFYQPNNPYPLNHTDSSGINVATNANCILSIPTSGTLMHETIATAPILDVEISVSSDNHVVTPSTSGDNYLVGFGAGIYTDEVTMVTSIEEDWNAIHSAGRYSGTVEVEVTEGSL